MNRELPPTRTTTNDPIPPDVLDRMHEIERQKAMAFYAPLFTAITEAATSGPRMLAENQRALERRERTDRERAEWIKRYRGRMFALIATTSAFLPSKQLGDGSVEAITKNITNSITQNLSAEESETWLPKTQKDVLLLLQHRMERSLQETIDGSLLSQSTRVFLQLPDAAPGGLEQINTQAIVTSELERHAKEITRHRILESISPAARQESLDGAALRVLNKRVESEWRVTFEAQGYDHLIKRFAALELRPGAPQSADVDNDNISLEELTTRVSHALTKARDTLQIQDAGFWTQLQKERHLTNDQIESIKSSVLNTSPESLVEQILYNILPYATETERREVTATLLRYGGLKFLLSLPPHTQQLGMSASRLLITEPADWDHITPLRSTGTEADLDEVVKQHLQFLIQSLSKTFAPQESSFVPDVRIEQLRRDMAPQDAPPTTPATPNTPTESRMAGEVE